MKKVVFIAHGLSDGGAEKVASILANYMSQNGFEVNYVCAYRNVNNTNREEYHLNDCIGIHYVEINARTHFYRFLLRNWKIARIIREIKPDIIVSFINFDTLFTSFRKTPIIYSLRNDPKHVQGSKLRSFIMGLEYSRASRIVFQTESARSAFGERVKQKSVVIANPILTRELPLWLDEHHRKVFITACRLNRQKNLPMMVDAFAKVHAAHPDYSLEIYGDGELRELVSARIAEKDACDYIRIMGYSTDIYSIMKNAAGFLLSSDYEGLSNAMLEALCIGLPCVCTDCSPGSAKEYIQDGVNGYLCEVGNSDQMAEKICALIECEDDVKRFSQASLVFREALDINTICEKWSKLL